MRQSLIQTDGIAIRSLRFARGLNAYELGRLSRVHGATIGRLERGERQGSPAVLKRVADALGVSVADITRPVARSTEPAGNAA